MNSTHEKLFVKRNIKTKARVYSGVESKYSRSIKTVAQINENILLAGRTGKPSCDKLLEKNNEGSLHNELKPLLIVLRLLGCFPVNFSKSDVPRYRAFSPVFIYSVCLYVVANIMSFLSARNIVLHLFKKDDSISVFIFNSILIVILVNCIGFPALVCLDTPKFVQYLQKWEEFQMMFATVTGDQLILSTRRFTIYILMIVCVTSPSMLMLHFVPPYLQWWQLPCYCLSYLVMFMTMCTLSTMFQSLFRAGTLLNNCFKRDVNHHNLSAELLGKYRILWLRWSQLVSQIGCVLGKVFSLYLVQLLIAIIGSIYGWLLGIKTRTLNLWMHIQCGLFCLLYTGTMLHFCNYGHYIANIVGVEIRDELQLLGPSEVRDDISQEVNMFLETMIMYPPVVSVAGFTNVDRGLFRAFASTVVTYMIVLVQFDQSEHSHSECSRNVTK